MICNYEISLYVSDATLAKRLYQSNRTHLLYNYPCKAISEEHARDFVFSQLEPIAKGNPLPFFAAVFTYNNKVDHIYMINGDVKIFATYDIGDSATADFVNKKGLYKVCAK